jgi:hypothetical protein
MAKKIEYVEGKIMITKTPDGEAPLRVREEWVGVVLPVIATTNERGRGVLSRKAADDEPAYVVLQAAAIKALDEKSPKAAKWWKSKGFPQSKKACFGFKIAHARKIGEFRQIPARLFVGLMEVGVGAHDHAENQHG